MEKSGNRRRFPAFALDFSRPVQETVARKGNCTDVPQVLEAFSQVLQVCFTFAINRILNPDVFSFPKGFIVAGICYNASYTKVPIKMPACLKCWILCILCLY